jgi:CRP/FNR family transcriptional regulator
MDVVKIGRAEKRQALETNQYFTGLSEALLDELTQSVSLLHYQKGEVLFWEGDPCAGLHIIQAGSVKLFRVSPQGRQYIVRVLQEGETCNEVPVFDGGPNPVNVEALEDTTAWVVDTQAVQALMRQNPDYALKVINNLGAQLRQLVRMVSEMAFFQVTHRLARLISETPEEALSGESGARLTQDQMAARLGTVREVVARSLKELERSGAIQVENRRIRVKDQSVLQEWTQPWN